MSAPTSLDLLGRRRSPATGSGDRAGRSSRTKGRRYPPDPPRTEEIIAVMRCCGDGLHGLRARGLIAVLWRSGLRVQEALDLTELDLDRRRGSLLVRRGKGGRRREVGMGRLGLRAIGAVAASARADADRPVVLRDQRPLVRSSVRASAARADGASSGG